jgi:diguanylate cyclase
MPGDVEITLRGPSAFGVARAAVDRMEAAKVWPTALNFELWTHLVADPEGALAREIDRLLQSGASITEQVSEDLAATFLPRGRLNEQIHDAGDALTRELASVSGAVRSAGDSARSYGQTLAAAGLELEAPFSGDDGLRSVVDTLSTATREAQAQNQWLDERLAESSREVTRLREDLDQVRKEAATDGLTNLANRRAFDAEMRRICSSGPEDGGDGIAVAVLDIDNFKRFNDTWGHQTGDQVLRFVASVVGRLAPAPRLAARYGGEEFTILFTGESARQIERVLTAIREAVSSRTLRRRSTDEDLGSVTLSAGFAERWTGEGAESLMARADAALYASKRGGRDRITRSDATDNAA